MCAMSLTLAEAEQKIARLNQLLEWEQNRHREYREQINNDPEFQVIYARRQRERSDRRTLEYIQKLLLEADERARRDEFHERAVAEMKIMESEDQDVSNGN
jgi:hypothetical protein